MGLSNLGIIHTIVGIVAITAALISYVKYQRIYLGSRSGLIYFYGTLITSLTAFGLSSTGGFNPGHILSLLVIALVLVAYFLYAKRKGNTGARYFETFCMSFSFFLSLIPTVNETFTRLPVGSPLANGPTDPLIATALLVLFVLFIAGFIYQFVRQRKINSQGEGA